MKSTIKRIILEKQKEIPALSIIEREMAFEENVSYVLIGPRRAGKSYLLYHDIQLRLHNGTASAEDFLYINFEDERIGGLTSESLGLILDAYSELYDRKPLIYLDEIQNIDGWEKFARRLADSKYRVMITGSNAKMLSNEISTVLGARYIPREVFPFSFAEFLRYKGITPGRNWEYDSSVTGAVVRTFNEYFQWGGFAETFDIIEKREWLNALYQKVLMGDIVERNSIRNPGVFRLLVRKLADSVMQPCTQQRLQHIIKSSGENISLPVLKDYLSYLEDAYLTFSINNLASPITEQETTKKRYFIDNGILGLFLIDGETKLLENIVALRLNRLFRNTKEENRLYYYNKNVVVDFCIPEIKLAIQVAYSIEHSEAYARETESLVKFLNAKEGYSGIIISYDTEMTIKTESRDIRVIPVWKWLLQSS